MATINCPQCGRRNPTGLEKCQWCRADLAMPSCGAAGIVASPRAASGSRVLMRVIAGGILGFGLVSGYFALTMDTTVVTPGGQMYGIDVPSYRVNNLGLMDERRTNLLVAGFTIIVGLGAMTASYYYPQAAGVSAAGSAVSTRRCPYCAEDIRAEAVVCRFCGRDVPSASSTEL